MNAGSTWSLLQLSPDQTIDRETLEEASVGVRSVARADCARLLRELSGILISGLERSEAVVFQMELARRSFPTELVADEDLPVLHEPFTSQRIRTSREGLIFSDYMGRTQSRPMADLVFLAGGMVSKVEFKTGWNLNVSYPASARGGAPKLEIEHQRKEELTTEFRLDFFFTSAPNRVRLAVAENTALFYQEEPLRLRNPAALEAMMRDLRDLLPPERVNAAIRFPDLKAVYPNLHSYENEIRWHFHRLQSAV